MPSIKLRADKAYEQGKLDKLASKKAAKTLKNSGVYQGTIENGMDLMRIESMVLDLFAKKKSPFKKLFQKFNLKYLQKETCNKKFDLQTLKLKPKQIEVFLEFCDADPKSKTVAESNNALSVMNFWFAKNIEFKIL